MRIMTAMALLICAAAASGEAWLGDHGHYLRMANDFAVLCPDGEPFTLTVQRDVAMPHYHGDVKVTVRNPDGEIVLDTATEIGQGETTFTIPAAQPGVYRVHTDGRGTYYFVRTNLDRMVVFAGDPTMEDAGGATWFHLMNHLPRRWWMFVPDGAEQFTLIVRHHSGTSGREDMGVEIHSPRGQKVKAYWGSPGLELKPGEQREITIPVERGMDGRFWSVVLSNADSHWHSDNELGFRGVRPWLAQGPGMWFDPETGEPAKANLPWREDDLEPGRYAHSLPNPWLGDQSYSGFVGPHEVLLRNAAGDPLTVGVGMYVLTTAPWQVTATAIGPEGDRLGGIEIDQPIEQVRENEHRFTIPAGHAGVQRLRVEGNHWFVWTDPALPMVVTPAEGERDALIGPAVTLETISPRHWYFHVPSGARRFAVKLFAPRAGDHVIAEVHAPDRLMRLLDVRRGEPAMTYIDVPEPLAGRRWFIRLRPGSGSELGGADPSVYHRPTVTAKLGLAGVPLRLAPTWSQWFPAE